MIIINLKSNNNDNDNHSFGYFSSSYIHVCQDKLPLSKDSKKEQTHTHTTKGFHNGGNKLLDKRQNLRESRIS